ncbi:M81 family metallopeptidase [Ideonella sp. BN130291]|uniref:M81 family metallopeptidase n=1 Tax=Ideonella sp. BN130291 TaxID=3112940 RepID=UPI002E267F8E|nr:M81 family metallopeptidase [Ideonella sp. BN130291]
MRVFVAGFQHETNTFAPTKADWAAFQAGAGYPAVSRGEAMLELIGPSSLPMGGFIRSARERGWTLLPSIWAGASPSAHVTKDAFERISAAAIEDLQRGGFDAVYLDLHGAAVAEHLDDAEGELLARIREVIGPQMPLVASLDLHANVTERMLRLATAMTAFRTYPHVDMAETGMRAAAMLAALHAGAHWSTRHLRIPFLLPLNAQCTLMEPAASVMTRLAALEAQHGVMLSCAMGFPAADFPECGPVVFGHGPDADAVQLAVNALAEQIVAQRAQWSLDLRAPREAVNEALALAEQSEGPVVIADTQDNPGAGGDANTTGMLHAVLAAGAGQRWPGRVALGLLHDAQAAATASAGGPGALLELRLGQAVPTYAGGLSDPPLRCRCVVRAVSDGVVPLHGPMTAGSTARLGPSACVDIDGVLVLITSAKCQMLDLDLYRFLGVQPERMKILVNKSSVHFRAAFGPIASHILVAKAPGPMAADPADLPWRRLPSQIARRP